MLQFLPRRTSLEVAQGGLMPFTVKSDAKDACVSRAPPGEEAEPKSVPHLRRVIAGLRTALGALGGAALTLFRYHAPNCPGGEQVVSKAQQMELPPTPNIICLLTHKCSSHTHSLVDRVANRLGRFGICVWCDPFEVGEDIDAKIETLGIDALLFLASPESLRSDRCLQELAAARARRLPVFTLRLEGHVPDHLSRRLYLDLAIPNALGRRLDELAQAIRARVILFRQIKGLSAQARFERADTLKRIVDQEDRTVIAEFLDLLADEFVNLDDPTAQFWIATAIGHAHTPEAGLTLIELATNPACHPYAYQGMVDGLEMLRHEFPQLEKSPQIALTIGNLVDRIGGVS